MKLESFSSSLNPNKSTMVVKTLADSFCSCWSHLPSISIFWATTSSLMALVSHYFHEFLSPLAPLLICSYRLLRMIQWYLLIRGIKQNRSVQFFHMRFTFFKTDLWLLILMNKLIIVNKLGIYINRERDKITKN